jgi:hypothetical protein
MLTEVLSQKGVRRSMQNAFTPEINKKATFSSAVVGDELEVSCTYEGEEYNYVALAKGVQNKQRVTPASAIYKAVSHFQEVFKDVADKKQAIEEAKAEIKAEAIKEIKAEASPEPVVVSEPESITVSGKVFSSEVWSGIKARLVNEKVTDVAKELDVSWQALSQANKKG